jgi:hypothetical protein
VDSFRFARDSLRASVLSDNPVLRSLSETAQLPVLRQTMKELPKKLMVVSEMAILPITNKFRPNCKDHQQRRFIRMGINLEALREHGYLYHSGS